MLALLVAALALVVHTISGYCETRSTVAIVPMLEHSSPIFSIAFSPDGGRIVTGSADHTLKLWEVASGSLLRTFEGHSGWVTSVAFSPDGSRIASSAGEGQDDNTIRVWDAASGKLLRTFTVNAEEGTIVSGVEASEGDPVEVNSVAFSPDGSRIVSGINDGTIRQWDVASGALLRTFKGHSEKVNSVAFSPDGSRIVSAAGDELERAGRDKTIRLWDAVSGKLLRTFPRRPEQVNAVAFSPDGSRILSASGNNDDSRRNKRIELWDATSGKLLRTFIGHSGWVTSVAFSPDGSRILSGSWGGTVKLWDAASGKVLRSITGGPVAAFSPDGRRIATGLDHWAALYDATSGAVLKAFRGFADGITSVAFSPDGSRIASGGSRPVSGLDAAISLWDTASGALVHRLEGHSGDVTSVTFSPDSSRVLSGSNDKTLKLWDATSGKLLRTFEGHSGAVDSVAFSPDGIRVLSGSEDNTLKLWDAASGKVLRTFEGHSGAVDSVAFSPDGSRILSGSSDGTSKLWDAGSGALLRTFDGHAGAVTAAFSPDGSRIFSSGSGNRLTSSGDGDPFKRNLKVWDAASGMLLQKFDGRGFESVAFSRDGSQVVSLGTSQDDDAIGPSSPKLQLWDAASGALLRTIDEQSQPTSVAFSFDGRRIVSGSKDGTIRIWSAAPNHAPTQLHGGLLITLIGGLRGAQDWVAMTPAGFFGAGQQGAEILSITRGLESINIEQVHQSLFNPDLVRESLAGDSEGDVHKASEVMNLDKVLDSGPPPLVEISSHPPRIISDTDLFTLSARIKDSGKGIGRIEWHLNGITVGVDNPPAGAGPVYEAKQELALDPGENVIEVVAYNGRNLLASLPAQTTIVYGGSADKEKPDLYIFAIGINKYVDKGSTVPGSEEGTYFPELTYAIPDATAFAEEMKKAGEGYYGNVRPTTALDEQATLAGLDRIVQDIATEIRPRDTFVLFAAAHGYSNMQNGRFYLIPQDYQGGTDPTALAGRAIGQERLQDWVANRIKAKKAIILLDTCRSGALTAGYTRSRIDEKPSEAGIGRLHEATGRPVLTAAAAGEDALEVRKLGHGVFTTALIDALHNGDSNNDGLIQVSELAAYVEEHVPKLADGSEVRAAIAKRGVGDSTRQSAHFGSTGGDFAVVKRLP